MKEVVISKLVSLEKKIGLVIRMVEDGKTCEKIIPEIDNARNEVCLVEKMMLEDHLATTLEQTKLKKSKRESIIKLCGF